MKHEQCLVELLRPLGVYDLNYGTVNRDELAVYGEALDEVFETLEEIGRESILPTAEGAGLELIQGLLPFRPVSASSHELRQALAALLRIGGDSFTLEAVNNTLAGCGINAMAAEGDSPGYVEVSFPGVKGVPSAFEELRVIIEEILPCHLGITYQFAYNTWATLGTVLSSWGNAEKQGVSWYGLSILRS